MRIATFNVLHGHPVPGPSAHSTSHLPPTRNSGYVDLEGAVAALEADVIALQEVDRNQQRSAHHHQAKVVAETIEAPHWRYVPTVIGTPGGAGGFRSTSAAERHPDLDPSHSDYGIALLSRLPVLQWRTTVFPAAPLSLPLLVQTNGRPSILRVRDEQRAAIAAVVQTQFGAVTVVTTHLSFVPGFNARQLRKVQQWVQDLPRPLILLGDFNLPGDLPRRLTGLDPLVAQPTFPSYRPRIQFDHVLADGFSRDQVTAARLRSTVLSPGVSDHCAVVVDLTSSLSMDS